MNVMYLCDDSYAMIAGVSIYSLLKNNQDVVEVNIFLVADAISEENKSKIIDIVDTFGRTIYFLDKPDIKNLLGSKVEMHWWIENVFSRVFLEEVLKNYKEVHRLIYIDCDTLVVGSIEDLWNLDLKGHIGAGVCEAMGNLHKKAIGLSKEDNYFNAGVFVIDVDKWRNLHLDINAKNFVKSVNGQMEYADESVLNAIIAKDLIKLSPKYNLTSLSVYFSEKEVKKYRKSYINYTEDERKQALSDARIIHFTSTYLDVRPWVEGCNHPYANEWILYKSQTPWKEEILKKDVRSRKKRIARKIVLAVPKRMRLILTGWIHAYVKPLRYIL